MIDLAGQRSYPVLDSLEAQCKAPVTIETQPTNANLSKCHPQSQSLLFKLPGEIRNLILEYATLPGYDLKNQYPSTAIYYRPGHHARIVASTSILSTCRRAWLEANHLPMQQTRHCFWMQDKSTRPSFLEKIYPEERERLNSFMKRLTINGRRNVKELQIFAVLDWLRLSFPNLVKYLLDCYGFCPETLILTIRHSDWQKTPHTRPLLPLAEQQWMQYLLRYPARPRLRQIQLELETTESHVRELRPIVERIRQKFKLVKRPDSLGTPCYVRLLDDGAFPESTWRGSSHLGRESRPPYASMEKVQYRIITVAWSVGPAPPDAEHTRREFGIEDDILESAHSPRSMPPAVTEISDRSNALGTTWKDDEHLKPWIEKWEKEGSLLTFAPKSESWT